MTKGKGSKIYHDLEIPAAGTTPEVTMIQQVLGASLVGFGALTLALRSWTLQLYLANAEERDMVISPDSIMSRLLVLFFAIMAWWAVRTGILIFFGFYPI